MSEKYFHGLNYTLANEDTWVEYNLAPENAESIFTVCGSGSRAIPLLGKNPKEMHVVDLSDAQLKLFRLRLQAIKKLSHAEYLFFLGYVSASPSNESRRDMIRKFELSPEDQKFWQSHTELWDVNGFIYLGKWEKHFMKLGSLFQFITRGNLKPLFEANNLEEQKKILNKYWKAPLFKLYTKIVMNEWVANKLLYKGHFAGGKEVKTMNISASQYVYQEFNDLFNNSWVKKNYFLQMIFLNRVVHPEAFPIECDQEVFMKIKNSQTKIIFHQENLLALLNKRPHSFYSLSDTFSYMSDNEVKDFLAGLPSSITSGTKMVIRTFMRKPTFSLVSPWKTDKQKNLDAAKEDCTRMYEFTILEKD